jgi:hypothetical protein
MMRKVAACLLLVGLLALGTQLGWSQDKKVNLSLNAGVQSNLFSGTSFDYVDFTLDFRAGIALGKSFEISPEVMLLVDDSFDFSYFEVSPGVLLNYKAGNFFVGAGVILPILLGDESDVGNPAPKINVGYNFGKFKLTAYIITLIESGIDFLDYNYIGATLGYRF